MLQPIKTGSVHHLTLTVSSLERAMGFYTGLLGFQEAMRLGPSRVLLSNGQTILAIGEPPDPSRAVQADRFDENRVGLDHLSFAVGSLADLEAAAHTLDEAGYSHGEIKDLGSDLGLYVLAFRDPDNIQLELTAPYPQG